MRRVDVVVLERDLEAVTRELGRLGLIHLEPARLENGEALLAPGDAAAEIAARNALSARIAALAKSLELDGDVPTEPAAAADPAVIEDHAATLARQVEDLEARHERAAAEEDRLLRLLEQVTPFVPLDVPLRRLDELEFLHVAIGTMPTEAADRLARSARHDVVLLPVSEVGDGRRRLLAAASRKGRWALDTALAQHDFQPDARPEDGSRPAAEIARAAQERLRRVHEEQAAVHAAFQALRREHGPALLRYARDLDVQKRLLSAREFMSRSESAYLIRGWVPARRAGLFEAQVQAATNGRAVLRAQDPDGLPEEPPVQLTNAPMVRPFEVLVCGYGTPGYREVEPTPLVAITYLVMFGLMFGDVGQGLVLALVGWWLSRRARSTGMRGIGGVMTFAGLSGALFGFVYNSVFSKEEFFPYHPLLNPLASARDVQVLLAIAVGFGALVLTAGTVVNIVNRLKSGDTFAGVVDRFGVLGIVIYWGAIGMGVQAALFGVPVQVWELAVFIGLPLLLLFFKEPLLARLTHQHKLFHEGVMSGVIGGFVEWLETLSGILANTLSFLRVGAFALAHAGLSLGVYAVAGLVQNGGAGGAISAGIVIVLGNALIIALEGLVVGIQATRLEYYEFFSRFFRGTGRAFRPFEIGLPAGK
jgi:V/A-type H+-transporting ATPase subunit I